MVYSRLFNVHRDEMESDDGDGGGVRGSKPNKYHMSRGMQVLCGMVVLYSVTASFAGLLLYQLAANRMETILVYKPTYMNWLGLRRVLAVKSQFLMRESWLPPSLSYPALIPSTQTDYSSVVSWEHTYSFLKQTHYCFVSGCKHTEINHLFPTDAHKDLLLGSCTNCTVAQQAGVTPLINEVVLSSAAAREDVLTNNTKDYSKGKKVEKLISTLLTVLTTSNDQFNFDCQRSIQAASDEVLNELVASECILFLILLLGIVPLLVKETGRVEMELTTIQFFPEDSLAQGILEI